MKPRRAYDVSLVMNTHAGSVFLTRALRSLEEAAFEAREIGLRLELVFIMNDSPPGHLELVRRYASAVYDDIVIVEVSRASLGAARQDGLDVARGEYVCFADDDDLVSNNSIVEFIATARRLGPRTIVVPQYLVSFGHLNFVTEYKNSDVVSPLAWIKYHPFVSRIFIHASAADRLRYADVAPDGTYGYEDWHFNAGAIAQGYDFAISPGTILFYRQRSAGLLSQFDAASIRQIPPSPLFEPETYLRVCADASARFDGTFPPVDFDAVRRTFTEDLGCRVATFAANQIDPTVCWETIAGGTAWVNWFGDLRPGAAYYKACEILGRSNFDHVILCQDLADHVVARRARLLIEATRAIRPDVRFLVLAADDAWSAASAPEGLSTVSLKALYPGLSAEDIGPIALRIIENTAATARLHLFGGGFVRSFYLLYRKVLATHRPIYYRNEDSVRFSDRLTTIDKPDVAFLSEVLPSLAFVVSDCVYGLMRDRACFGVHEERLTHFYALPPDSHRAVHGGDPVGEGRFMWITGASDPNAAGLVHSVEDSLSSLGVAVSLTVVENASLWDLTEDGATAIYDGVIHTAFVENLPAILLEALAAGVPVIGVANGGVAEAVLDGETGWLIQPGPAAEIAPILVEAIRQCYRGTEAHTRRSSGAVRRALDMRESGGVEAFLAIALDSPAR